MVEHLTCNQAVEGSIPFVSNEIKMDEEITKEQLFNSLAAACTVCPPDEYQQRHNLLIRQVAAFLTKDYAKSCEGTEDP